VPEGAQQTNNQLGDKTRTPVYSTGENGAILEATTVNIKEI